MRHVGLSSMALDLEVVVTFGPLQPSSVKLHWGDRLFKLTDRCGFFGNVDMQDWQVLSSKFVPLRDGATWQESFRVDEARIVVCQPRPIRLLFRIGSRGVAMQVHDARSLEGVLMRFPIGRSLVKGMTWVSMASGGSIMQGNTLADGDIIVAWLSDVWALEQEL